MTYEEVKQVFADLCRLQGIAEFDFDESESATTPFGEEGDVLHIQYRRDRGDVVLLAPLGKLPDLSASYVLETLLAANLYWQSTHGATIAWNVEMEQPILQFAVPKASMQAPVLAEVLAGFLSAVEEWRANIVMLVTNPPDDPEPEDNVDDDYDDEIEPSWLDETGFIAV